MLGVIFDWFAVRKFGRKEFYAVSSHDVLRQTVEIKIGSILMFT
jgi:hypothetical protein